jgi:hypothetical protein
MHLTHVFSTVRPDRWRVVAATLAIVCCAAVLGAIAGPAVAAPLPPDWVARGSGTFTTATDPSDFLSYRVERNAVDQLLVEFRLEDFNRCHWWKEIVVPDGLGWEGHLNVDASRGVFTDTETLKAGHVHNGQQLKFWKAGFLGVPRWVMNVDIDAVAPGSRVTFRWLRDSGGC